MADESGEYELLPHEEIERLRKEVETLKRDPLAGMGSSKTLIDAMDSLTRSMNNFLKVLQQAQTDIVHEYEGTRPQEKLNKILEQNERIAKALLVLAEKLPDKNERLFSPQQPAQPTQQEQPFPAQQFYQSQNYPPPVSPPQRQPSMPPPPANPPFPNIPPPPKRGLFR